jgi:hypothetical protein
MLASLLYCLLREIFREIVVAVVSAGRRDRR